MKRVLFLIYFVLAATVSFAQSILINPEGQSESSLSAFELTEQVLIDGGNCSSISNFTYKENPERPFPNADRSWGYFEKGDSNFPFERGIILTSGFARRANGPTKSWSNLSDGSSTAWPGDADATVLADVSTKNATVFEFDFVPFGDEISFNYIFASSEYPAFSCSSFNDVFGFIISGPGIVNDPGLDGKNIALLPNGDWVTINNVNDDYCGDDTYYVAGPFQDIAHGGRTVPLTAYSEVIPFETYHIRLLVADAVDHRADSAVFLEAGSFALGTVLIDVFGDEIGEFKLLCDETEFHMSTNTELPGASYQWYFNGVPIPGATGTSYTATESGVYMLEVFAGSCSDTKEVEIVFSTTPEIKDFEPFEQCSTSGTYIFDLSDYYDDISEDEGVIFNFYLSEEGATTGELGDIIPDIHNFPVTGTIIIWVRVQNEDGCFIIVPVTLIVKTGPDTIAAEQRVCNFEGGDTHLFDLTESESDLAASDPTELTFEYYLDPEMTQLIADPENFTNTTNPQIIYVKVYFTAEGEESCRSEETLTLQVDPFPVLQPDEIVVCDNLNDGTETVDLTLNNIVVTPGIAVVYQYWDADGNLIPDPENYTVNGSPETITVKVLTEDENCEDEELLTIVFMAAPELNNAELEECSQDGQAVFHLPEADEIVTDDPTETIIGYFLTFDDAQNNINPLPSDYTNEFPGQIIYVRVENEDGCYNIAEIILLIDEGPESLPFSEEICDDDGDGSMEFDLTALVPNMLPGGTTDIEIHYFLDPELTQEINNPEEFVNTVNPQTVYVSFVDTTLGEDACVSTNELNLKVNEFPEIQSDEIYICDNLNDGTETIDLTDNNIVLTPGISVTYLYFEADGTQIGNPEAYTLTSSPVEITVTVINADGSCEDSAILTIYMDEAPEMLEEMAVLIYCSLDDYAHFHLPDAVPNILIGDPEDYEISFHLTFEDARNNLNPLPYDYTNVTPDQIVYVRVEDDKGCFNIGEIQLSTILIHKELSEPLTVCDDPYLPNDGIAVFDLTERNAEIEDILEGSFEIEFFTSLEDALAGINIIPDPTQFENTENPQTIFARAIAQDGSCSGIVEFDIEVLPVPEFELPDYLAFCDYDTIKSYQFYGDFTSYLWRDPDGNVVSTTAEVIFTGEGTYTLEVTEAGLSCPARREIEIIFDNAPIILEIIVDGHTVTIVSSGGEPPVSYSYNNGLTWGGGLFYDVPGGIYEMLARSKYGCISEGKAFGVLGVPNVITPNDDGKNDFWEIRGVAAFPAANIKIFDRFGKKFVDRPLTTDFRWDGKYLGNPVPSGDYWYLITLEDGKKIVGHISVRNQ